jgi:predicted nucleotidyltransferase
MPAGKAVSEKRGKRFGGLEQELADDKLVKDAKPMAAAPAAQHRLDDELFAKVVRFTNEARKQYGNVVKSVLIFGSAARGGMVKGSDADIWVVLDDTATKGTADLERVTAHLQLIAHEAKDLHVQTTALTEFWQWMKLGSPELVNFLRYSLPVYDTGFIKPVKRMLDMGLLPPSEETVKLKAMAGRTRLKKVELDMRSMVFESRYAALDTCQAVAMHYYKQQPDAKSMPDTLRRLVKDRKLQAAYVRKFEQLNKLWKDIDHGKVKEIDCGYLGKAVALAEDIVERMDRLLPKEMREEKK